jgi:hypothetical protein
MLISSLSSFTHLTADLIPYSMKILE